MTDTTPELGFRQFPAALKFIVIWTIILGLLHFWEVFTDIVESFRINLPEILATGVYFNLASGLIHKQDSSRIWSIVFLVIGTLARFVFLPLIYLDHFNIKFNFLAFDYSLSDIQAIIFLSVNIILNIILLYILLRPSTKALFTPPPSPEPTLQQTV